MIKEITKTFSDFNASGNKIETDFFTFPAKSIARGLVAIVKTPFAADGLEWAQLGVGKTDNEFCYLPGNGNIDGQATAPQLFDGTIYISDTETTGKLTLFLSEGINGSDLTAGEVDFYLDTDFVQA